MVGGPNGSRIIFSREPGGSSGQHILTSPELTHEVVISPGLPTPPLSPFRSARLPSGEVKVCTVTSKRVRLITMLSPIIQQTSAPPCGKMMHHSLYIQTLDMIVSNCLYYWCTCIILASSRCQKWMEVDQQLSALDLTMAPHKHTVRLCFFFFCLCTSK